MRGVDPEFSVLSVSLQLNNELCRVEMHEADISQNKRARGWLDQV